VTSGAWIVWALAAAAVAISTTNPVYLLLLFAVAFLVRSACLRTGPGARSWRIFVLLAVWAICLRTALVLFGPVTAGSVVGAALEGLRIGVLLALFGAFNSVADPFGVLRLAPRRFHEAALAAALAISIAPRTIAAVQRVLEAQKMRGIEVAGWRTVPALAVPVLSTGMEEAVTLAESMDARGHGRGPRSRYRVERWGGGSWIAVIAALLAAAAFIAHGVASAGGLSPSTFPLQWPEVSWALLAAVLLLAAPAFVTGRDV
jgi:energy-coupling factor transport system permease protein